MPVGLLELDCAIDPGPARLGPHDAEEAVLRRMPVLSIRACLNFCKCQLGPVLHMDSWIIVGIILFEKVCCKICHVAFLMVVVKPRRFTGPKVFGNWCL